MIFGLDLPNDAIIYTFTTSFFLKMINKNNNQKTSVKCRFFSWLPTWEPFQHHGQLKIIEEDSFSCH